MKKLSSIKLAQLNEQELSKREMNRLVGGAPGDCCVCAYGYYNYYANLDDGLYSPSLMGTYSNFRD